MATKHKVAVIDDEAQRTESDGSKQFFDAIERAVESSESGRRVAIDCEGINLCRVGTVEVVSLCFDDATYEGMDSKTIFLVDLNSKSDSALLEDRITALRQLFESETVAKIIHDCRMDCDALYHLHIISLNNIHDTSCFHGTSDIGLNDLLAYHALSPNATRDGSVYGANPKFWATRPMTSQMMQWASADVEKLLLLADRQLQRRG